MGEEDATAQPSVHEKHERRKNRLELIRLAFFSLGKERFQKMKAGLANLKHNKSLRMAKLKAHLRESLMKMKQRRRKGKGKGKEVDREEESELSTAHESLNRSKLQSDKNSLSEMLSDANLESDELEKMLEDDEQDVDEIIASFGVSDDLRDEGIATYEEEYLKQIKEEEAAYLDRQVPKLASFHELPHWMKDNEYIVRGYRLHYDKKKTAKSFIEGHNETGNIWTHFLGVLMIFGLALYAYVDMLNGRELRDYLLFTCFFLGAALCLGMSAGFHWFMHLHEKANKLLAKLDYAGISTLIVGSQVPIIVYSFTCWPVHSLVYSIVMSAFGAVVMIVSLVEWFSQPKFRWFRAILFIVFGVSSIVPIGHYVILVGFQMAVESGFALILALAALYIVGALIYAARMPERFSPGKFDFVGHGHQIFHVFVVGGALSTFFAIKMAMEHWGNAAAVPLLCAQLTNSTMVIGGGE